jgi:hypothetical protein
MMNPQPESQIFGNPASGARHIRADAMLVEGSHAPIGYERALAALSSQPELASPAKLYVTPHGEPGLLAEVPRTLDRRRCESLATGALDAAVAWLDGATLPAAVGPAHASEEVEAALASLAWRFDHSEDGSYRVHAGGAHANGAGFSARVRVAAIGADRLHVSTSTALAYVEPQAARALTRFALETSRRLRLARLSVGVPDAATARVVWDAVVLSELGLDRALPEAVQAVTCARAETARGLAALADARVAREFLRIRGALSQCDRNDPAAFTGEVKK